MSAYPGGGEGGNRRGIVIITKLRTTNLGNEALSSELAKLAWETYGDRVSVIGRPAGLDAYSSSRLRREGGDPCEVLERWADRIVGRFRRDGVDAMWTPAATLPAVQLMSPDSAAVRQATVRAFARRARAWMLRAVPYAPAYRRRLELFRSAEAVLYSAAGEIAATEVCFRQLLELRVAQLLGCRTLAMNQSIVLEEALFRTLLAYVYGRMDRIVVRGARSRDELTGLGIRPDIVDIAPDTAFCAEPLAALPELMVTAERPRVGLSITPKVAGDMNAWSGVVEHLRDLGYEPVFVTNEPSGDREIAATLEARHGVRGLGRHTDYRQYASRLGELEFVISARLHTNVLALLAGTPVIPVEGRVFKTQEIFEQIRYPGPVIRVDNGDWSGELRKSISRLRAERQEIRSAIRLLLPGIREAARKNVIVY